MSNSVAKFLRELFGSEGVAASREVITVQEWIERLSAVKVRKEDMNKLVMNFLSTEGYIEAAEKFQLESGTEREIDPATIAVCMTVTREILSGNVEDPFDRFNDLNPEIFSSNPQLLLHLLQQLLIELIRNGKVEEALKIVEEELDHRAQEDESFLEMFEMTMALLESEDIYSCPVNELLDVSRRLKVACEFNKAILTSRGHDQDPKLLSLLKMLMWEQHLLSDKASFPLITQICNRSHLMFF